MIGQRGVLVVANGNMLNLKSILPVVRHSSHLKLSMELQLLFVEQADDGSNTEACLGFFKPGINYVLRYLIVGFFLNLGLGAAVCAATFSVELPFTFSIWANEARTTIGSGA